MKNSQRHLSPKIIIFYYLPLNFNIFFLIFHFPYFLSGRFATLKIGIEAPEDSDGKIVHIEDKPMDVWSASTPCFPILSSFCLTC